ncbi:hypothetical protein PIB30_052106 [Stylosanthes scabra]|uniref:Uncharacterized protein n=1 Tax=Stylosanthes scabra TaxID=79078 RepID=A0ABU6TKD3_9FABA|nr:hypothetical protein [Stylosanthes scabra]
MESVAGKAKKHTLPHHQFPPLKEERRERGSLGLKQDLTLEHKTSRLNHVQMWLKCGAHQVTKPQASHPGAKHTMFEPRPNVTQTWCTPSPKLKRDAHQANNKQRSSPWGQAHHIKATPKRGLGVVPPMLIHKYHA